MTNSSRTSRGPVQLMSGSRYRAATRRFRDTAPESLRPPGHSVRVPALARPRTQYLATRFYAPDLQAFCVCLYQSVLEKLVPLPCKLGIHLQRICQYICCVSHCQIGKALSANLIPSTKEFVSGLRLIFLIEGIQYLPYVRSSVGAIVPCQSSF